MLVRMFKSLVRSIIKYVGSCFLLDQREMGNIQCRTAYLTLDLRENFNFILRFSITILIKFSHLNHDLTQYFYLRSIVAIPLQEAL